jgi:hypothetical protein
MKNILNFYIIILSPFVILMLFVKFNLIDNYTWAIFLIIYCLVYHPLISGLRLIAANKIKKNELWHCFIPGWNWKHFSFLFFNHNDYVHGK